MMKILMSVLAASAVPSYADDSQLRNVVETGHASTAERSILPKNVRRLYKLITVTHIKNAEQAGCWAMWCCDEAGDDPTAKSLCEYWIKESSLRVNENFKCKWLNGAWDDSGCTDADVEKGTTLALGHLFQ